MASRRVLGAHRPTVRSGAVRPKRWRLVYDLARSPIVQGEKPGEQPTISSPYGAVLWRCQLSTIVAPSMRPIASGVTHRLRGAWLTSIPERVDPGSACVSAPIEMISTPDSRRSAPDRATPPETSRTADRLSPRQRTHSREIMLSSSMRLTRRPSLTQLGQRIDLDFERQSDESCGRTNSIAAAMLPARQRDCP